MLETLALVKWPLLAAVLASLPLAYYGVFLVERRMVFVSVTLAQSALCGAALSFLVSWEPRVGALLAVGATIAALALWGRGGRRSLPEDSVLGVLYVLLGALAVIFLSKSVQGGLDEATLLFGSLLGVSQRDVELLAATVAALGLLLLWGHRRFLAVTFDAETSRVLGMPVGRLELAFFAGLGVLLGVSISQLGVLLSFAFLVLPAASARAFGRGTRSVVGAACAIGVLGSVAGTLASIHWDVPTGAAICLALALPLPAALAIRGR